MDETASPRPSHVTVRRLAGRYLAHPFVPHPARAATTASRSPAAVPPARGRPRLPDSMHRASPGTRRRVPMHRAAVALALIVAACNGADETASDGAPTAGDTIR